MVERLEKKIEAQPCSDLITPLSPITLFRRSGPDTGYYSDRNDGRAGYRDERGYLSDHSSRGLAPNYRQDSIRSGYISDHESRSGYEHRGKSSCGGVLVKDTIYSPRWIVWSQYEKQLLLQA